MKEKAGPKPAGRCPAAAVAATEEAARSGSADANRPLPSSLSPLPTLAGSTVVAAAAALSPATTPYCGLSNARARATCRVGGAARPVLAAQQVHQEADILDALPQPGVGGAAPLQRAAGLAQRRQHLQDEADVVVVLDVAAFVGGRSVGEEVGRGGVRELGDDERADGLEEDMCGEAGGGGRVPEEVVAELGPGGEEGWVGEGGGDEGGFVGEV